MPKRKVHFIGFLANVGESIPKVRLKDNFEVKKLTRQEVMPFLQRIDFQCKVDRRANIREKQGNQARGCAKTTGLCEEGN